MTEHQRQLLSAYLDDALEADEAAEFASMLDAAGEHPHMARTLHAYVAIGEAMRGRLPAKRSGVAARVAVALRDEPVPAPAEPEPARPANVLPMRRPARPGWQKVARSVAMAATVAAVAIGGVRMMNTTSEVDAAPVVVSADDPRSFDGGATQAGAQSWAQLAALGNETTIPPTSAELAVLPAAMVIPVSSNDAPQTAADDATSEWDRLQPNVAARMQAYFLQHSEVTRNSVRGMLPYARLVGHGSERE